MRRGIGRARLCDIAPCPERWPCPKHGTCRVGDYEHLGRHAGAFELAPIVHGAQVVSETVPCKGCGWALCSCPPARGVWRRLVAEVDREIYEHSSFARVWQCGSIDCLGWGYFTGGRCVPCNSREAKATRDEAMLAVESLLP